MYTSGSDGEPSPSCVITDKRYAKEAHAGKSKGGGGQRAQICSSQRVPSVPREAIHERLRGCLGRPSEGLCRQASLSRRSL